ncbi:hypothetical protein UCDDS831_g04215 [Diplodia seriata]|uniref:NACHT-NTPase and P-loop NTPases N-terminal domain-containing protein n=1 Tax=Diplodia seriata TaxID=420778 RepID=A0A0G2EG30_9PEZI|nr:hypothetical protein UCDDS831_g04215 [Diplodia seriata]
MAEVIGILSGAITFIDAGSKVAKLLSSLKNAPKQIAAYQEELQDMVRLVTSMKDDLNRLSNGTGSLPSWLISQPDLSEIERFIRESESTAKQLEAWLNDATASSQHGRMEKSWKAIRARKLQSKILDKLERMKDLKGSMQFWLNRQTYLISTGQM